MVNISLTTRHGKFWTKEEDDFLRFSYPRKDFSIQEIMKALCRSYGSISARATKLGLKRYKEPIPDGFKRCPRCDTILPITNFYRLKNGTLQGWCKACKYKMHLYYSKQKRNENSETKNLNITAIKVCKGCNKELPITEFYKNKKMKDGYLNHCKICKNEYDRKRYIKGGY